MTFLVTEDGRKLTTEAGDKLAAVGGHGSPSSGGGNFSHFSTYPLDAVPKHIFGGSNLEMSFKSFISQGVVAIILDGVNNVYLHDLDFDSCLGCIFLVGCTGDVRIERIRARNTGNSTGVGGSTGSGQSCVIQLASCHVTGGIRDCKSYGGLTEDVINLYESGGVDSANPFYIENNHIESPLPGDPLSYQSGSGTAINTADSVGQANSTQCHDVICQNNIVVNGGQVGITCYRGNRVKIRNNIVLGLSREMSNVGIYTPYTENSYTGDNEVSGNRVYWETVLSGNRVFGGGGTYYGDGNGDAIFDGGISGTVDGLSPQTNVIQDTTLDIATLHVNLNPAPGGDRTAWAPSGVIPMTDVAAAALVTHVAEVMSGNATANNYVPSNGELAAFQASLDDNGDTPSQYSAYYGAVTGRPGLTNPSTDDLIQWASHKWGIPTDWIRAEAVDESSWDQANLGDLNTVSPSDYALYPAAAQNGPYDVYQSMGLMQVKWTPDGNINAGTEPLRWKSTAFNLDYYGATIRYFYDGMCVWCTPGYVANDEWGSIGGWFEPSPWNSAGALAYIANVQAILAARTWETY